MKKRLAPVTLLAILVLSGIWSLLSVLGIQGNARVINYTGVVRGATQLLVKEELYGTPNDALIRRLDQIIDELMTGEGEHGLLMLPDPDYQAAMGVLREGWLKIKEEIQAVRGGGGEEALYQLSQSFFQDADRAVSKAEAYTEGQVRFTVWMFCALFALVAAGTGLFAANEVRSRRRLRLVEAAEANSKKEKEKLEKMSAALRACLDDLSELMYVADLETYDLLFFNKPGLQNFGLDSYEGKKCYQVLRGLDAPCGHCRSHGPPDGETYTWEDTNPVTGRHYMLKDREILWDGRPARLEIAFDITEAEEEKQRLRDTLRMEDLMMDCVRTLYQGPDPAQAIPQVLEKLGRFLQAERSYIFLARGGVACNEYEWCKEGVEPQKETLQALPLSFFERWMDRFERRECVLIPDLEQIRESSPEEYGILNRQKIHSLVAAPMERDGAFCGCLGVDNPPQDRLAYIGTMLQTLCYFLMLSLRRAQDERQLSHLSFHDTLTSFYNRNRFLKDAQALQDSKIPVGVVYLDVNGLKDANDKRGHAFGDELLREAARRIRAVFSGADLYRVGGDEFVVICREAGEQEFYRQVDALRRRFDADNGCSAAIGSQWCAAVGDMEALTSRADALMYEDKKEFYRRHPTSRRYRHQSDDLLELSNPNILESEIRQNRFTVYLQPKVSAGDRSAIGAEALVRYHPGAGAPVLPGGFLPLLEERQTVSQIDFFVFESVCARIKKWLGTGRAVYPVSINFSQHTLAQPSFAGQLCAICGEYGIEPKLLEVEIAGEALECGEYDLTAPVRQLRQAGFIVALSGFGAVGAAPRLLELAEFDVLKLNREMLVKAARDPGGVAAVVEACRKKGVRLVAEGIETERQMDELRSSGVELLQGFLFSKPISMEEYEEKYLSRQAAPGEE